MLMKNRIKNMLTKKQEGLGVIEIILIIVVLIALVIVFRDEITDLIKTIITKFKTELGTI